MAKLHLDGGVTFEGTPEEIKAYTDLYAEGGAEKAQEKPEPAPTFKEGDIVVITGNTTVSVNNVGDIGKITEISIREARVEVPGGPKLSNWSLFTEIRHATQAEREQYEESLKPKKPAPKFAVGDYVMPTEDYPQLAIVTKGEKLRIERVIAPNEGGDWYVVSGGWSISERYLTEYVEPSVFECIGRKEGEFKKGDIVRVGSNTDCTPFIGTTQIVRLYTDGLSGGNVYFEGYTDDNDDIQLGRNIELIAPVESRVDRP